MKYINKRQFLIAFGFLLIIVCTLTTKAYGQTIEVVSQDTFSTVSPPEEISVKLLEPLVLSEKHVYAAGTVMKGKLTDVISPKRLKRDAGFSFEPTVYFDSDGNQQDIKPKLKASYTTPIDKGELAKDVTLGVGSYFVKGLSMGIAAVSGAIKNEDNNRIKSSASAVYEASPISYIKKGEDIYIQKDEHFFLKFRSSKDEHKNSKKESESTSEQQTEKEHNYSYTTEKE